MGDFLENVAIIGAGLGGCALALALSQQNIPITVYESRSRGHDVLKSGVVLTPNGLWVLDQLGVFARIKDRCFKATHRVFKNDKDETVRKTVVADESLYGYRNHRIWRKLLLDEMKVMLEERGVGIQYDSVFNGVESEGEQGVTFLINRGARNASLLIGLDGVYSHVRRYLDPSIVPEYTGTTGVLAHIKRASVAWPYEDYEPNATIQGKPGAIFFLPEDPQWEDIMIGMQVQYPEQSREDLEKLQTDYDRLLEFYLKGYEEHGATARSIIDRVAENRETLYIWPYLKMPKLEHWFSNAGRVVLAGDGAHALPPSSGQGVNQALEDVYSLTHLLKSITPDHKTATDKTNGASQPNHTLLDTLAYWQQIRQKRIDSIFDWVNNFQNVERLPEAERKKLKSQGNDGAKGDDMRWLYEPTIERDVKAWVDGKG